jgi:hypothetical protein
VRTTKDLSEPAVINKATDMANSLMPTIAINDFQPGDIGWIVQKHAHIYATAGYCLKSTQPHHSFGQALDGEVWELALNGRA